MAIVALVVVIGAVVGVAALSSALGVRPWTVVAVAAAGVVGLALLAAVVGVAARGGGDDDDDGGNGGDEPAAPEVEVDVEVEAETAAPVRLRRPDLEVGFPGGLPRPAPVLDGLDDGDAPVVVVRGLLPNAWGVARQCTPDRAVCLPGIRVRTDDAGDAVTVVPLATTVEGRRCAPRCVLVVEVDFDVVTADLLFGVDVPAPPSVRVEPSSVRPGDLVAVTVTGLEPGADVSITQCSVIADDLDPCGGTAPAVGAVADADGTATAEYRVASGDVGARGGPPCRRGERCGITVVDGSAVLAEPAELRFLGSAGVEHDGARLAVGLALAAVLAAVVAWLIRTTDWRALGLPSTTDDAPDPF